MTRQEQLAAAQRHFQSGKRSEAEAIWRQVLSEEPNHPPATHMLGVMAYQAGRNKEALDLIGRAISLKPDAAEYHGNLGSVLLALGRVDESIAAYRHSLSLFPDSAEVHCNLGHALRRKEHFDEAITEYRQALTIRPDYPKAYSNLGHALRSVGRIDDAIAAHRKAIAIRPDYVEGHYNLGLALHAKGRLDEAVLSYQEALKKIPDAPTVLTSMARALLDRGRLDESVAAYSRVIQLRPNVAESYFNLGIVLHAQFRMDEAIDIYKKAVELRPLYTEALTNLGVVLKEVGRFDEAEVYYRKALEADPHNTIAASNIVYMHQFHAEYDPKMIYDGLREWNRQHAAPLAHLIRPHENDRTPDRKLRIGYVSADFRHHVVGANLLPIIREHDHTKFEIFCYSSVARPDEMTTRLRQSSDVWRDIHSLDDDQAADLIRRDKIDILVELTLHMAGHRLLLFARKPAPVQVTYLGYCGSTGLDAIDYRLSDPYLDPPEQDISLYSEKTIRVPVSYWCYQPPQSAPAVAPLPALNKGQITFACLNNFSKVTGPAMDLWTKVLHAVPNSKMLIHTLPGGHIEKARRRFVNGGISADRIEFIGKQPFAQYLATYNRIDLCLDPIPYGGGITSCDALWMGVPVVTLTGATPVSRAGWTILSNIGMADWVAHTPQRYVEIAAGLSSDLPRLAQIRAGLRDRMKTSPLMDSRRCARDIEAAYRQMWSDWTCHP